jgi:hypothetical protein
MAGHANTGGVTKVSEGRETGCECCQHFSIRKAKVATRRVARRAARRELREMISDG